MQKIIDLYPDADHNEPPRLYLINTSQWQAADADQQAEPDSFYFQAQGESQDQGTEYPQMERVRRHTRSAKYSLVKTVLLLILALEIIWLAKDFLGA